MKTLILALLLVPSLLFGQEQEQPGPPEFMVYEFDIRCLSPLEWSITLIEAKHDGVPIDLVIKKLTRDFTSGSLQDYKPETIEYMLAVISAVWLTPAHTRDGFLAVLHKVESICISYIENGYEEEPTKEELIST